MIKSSITQRGRGFVPKPESIEIELLFVFWGVGGGEGQGRSCVVPRGANAPLKIAKTEALIKILPYMHPYMDPQAKCVIYSSFTTKREYIELLFGTPTM